MPRATLMPTANRDAYDALRLRAGEVLFVEGSPGHAAYLVDSGEIEIFITRDGQDVTLARRGPGELIGEVAVIDRGPRSASARAITACKVIVIEAEKLEGRAASSDPILRLCLSVVISRYREAVAQLQAGHVPRPPEERPAPPGVSAQVHHTATQALRLERDLSRGLREGEFELHFQPIVALASRRLAGFEALMRWHHPRRGMVPPSEFIPMAEACGLIVEVTASAIRQLSRVLPAMLAAERGNPGGTEPLFMSVNVSPVDLLQPAFSQTVCEMLAAAGVPPARLKVEITESMIMTDLARATAALQVFQQAGIGVAIDDFGTGFSSLGSLAALPISTLKIDRGFVRSMLADRVQHRIVSTILRLADELDIPVVAEGIEGEAEAAALAALQCRYGQGYLFGRPLPFAAMPALIRDWPAPRAARPAASVLAPATP